MLSFLKKFFSHKLIQGKYYNFKIVNLTTLPDKLDYYVVEDPFGDRQMIPACYYDDYGFRIGQVIRCRVDKINCTGRIFLEPLHSVYREGKVYFFDFVEIKKIFNKDTGKEEDALNLKDVFGKMAQVSFANYNVSTGFTTDKIRCKLVRIKKGKLFLKICDKKISKIH